MYFLNANIYLKHIFIGFLCPDSSACNGGGSITFMSDCREDCLHFVTFQPLLTPVGHRLDGQEVGSSRQQAMQPHLTLRLWHGKE